MRALLIITGFGAQISGGGLLEANTNFEPSCSGLRVWGFCLVLSSEWGNGLWRLLLGIKEGLL